MKIHMGKTIIPGIETDPIPEMIKVRQIFPRPRLEDPPEEILRQMEGKLKAQDFAGKRIGIAAGSRKIARMDEIVKTVADKLKSWGALPFIFPAMGSHGGANPAGQREVLAGYGITEETMGVPIVSDSMEAHVIGSLEEGVPVYTCDTALKADGLVVINRIKRHTDFKGEHESGLLKMMVLGMGKHLGATAIHTLGFDRMADVLPRAAKIVLEKLPVCFGLGVLENAYDETMKLEVILPDAVLRREKELLAESKAAAGRLLMPRIDLLIIDKIGKDISGAGMDPNIVGRMGSGLTEGFAQVPDICRIAVLRLSPGSHGNGNGIGLADATTRACAEAIDWGDTYTNCIASTVSVPAKLPMVFETEKLAVFGALRTIPRVRPDTARIVRLASTLEIGKIQISPPVLEDMRAVPDIWSKLEIGSGPEPMSFDEADRLLP